MKRKISFLLLFFILCSCFASARDVGLMGNYTGYGIYKMFNMTELEPMNPLGVSYGGTGSNINCSGGEGLLFNTSSSSFYCAASNGTITSVATDDTYMTGGPITTAGTISFNASYANANLNVSKWNDFTSVNITQFFNNAILSIKESWLKSLFYIKSEVYNMTEIDAQQLAQNNSIIAVDGRVDILNTTGAIESLVNASYVNVVGDTMTGNLIINTNLTVDTNTLFVDSSNDRVGIGTITPDRILHVLGSNDRLKIETSGDSNTGIELESNLVVKAQLGYSAGSDALVFGHAEAGVTIATQDLVIKEGEVGVGTTTPANKLDVNGGIDSDTLNTGQGDNELYAMNQNVTTSSDVTFNALTVTGNAIFQGNVNITNVNQTNVNGSIEVQDLDGTTTIRLDGVTGRNSYFNAGNVGIGTSSPNYKITSGVLVTEISSDSGTELVLNHPDAATTAIVGDVIFARDDTDLAKIRGITDGAIDAGQINFYTTPTGGSSTSRMTIDSGGDVGIGTITPNSKLEVAGDIRLGGGQALLFGATTEGIQEEQVGNSIEQFARGQLRFYADTNDNSGSDYIAFYTNVAEGTTTSSKLIIDDAGNVGIGTDSPSRTLHVAGSPGVIMFEDTGGAVNDKKAQIFVDGGVFELNSRNDDDSTRVDNILTADLETGNVGIGTISPSDNLEISGALAGNGLTLDSSNGAGINIDRGVNTNAYKLEFQTAGVREWVLGSRGFGNDKFFVSNAADENVFTILQDGGVGIGTTSPLSQLHLEKTSDALADVGVVSNYNLFLRHPVSTNNVGPGIAFGTSVSTDNIGSSIIHERTDSEDKGKLHFYTKTTTSQGADPTLVMTLNDDGNVGIGTTTPNNLLQINSPTGKGSVLQLTTTDLGSDGASGFLMALQNNGVMQINNKENGDLYFATNNTEAMRIDTSGNVGIGTTSPGALMHIKIPATTAGTPLEVLRLETADEGANTAVGMGPKMTFYIPNSDGGLETAYIAAEKEATGDARRDTGMVFGTTANLGTVTERMRIDADGNVGIGTTSPSHEFNVVGDANITGTMYANDFVSPIAGVFAYAIPESGTTTNITTAGTWYPLSNMFNNTKIEQFYLNISEPAIVYNGSKTEFFEIDYHGTVKGDTNGISVNTGISVNDIFVVSSKMGNYLKTADEQYSISGTTVVELTPGDEIRLVATADGDGDKLEFDYYTTSIRRFY